MSPCLTFLVFNLLITFSLAGSSSQEKVEKAFQECNTTNPVQQNPRSLIINGIVSGDKILLTEEEKCHLYCFLQKVRFFDEDGNLRGPGLIKFARKNYPVIAQHNDVIIAQVFNLIRWTSGVEDKCQKAMVAYFRFNDYLFLWATTEGVKRFSDAKDKIIKDLEDSRSVPAEIQNQITQFWQSSDIMSKTNAPINLPIQLAAFSNQSETFDESLSQASYPQSLKFLISMVAIHIIM